MKKNKKSIAVLFGGRSVEHEISVITALQAMSAIDPLSYSVIPVYVDKNGLWFTGSCLFDRNFYKNLPFSLPKAQRITLLPDPSIQGLIPINAKGHLSVNDTIPVDVFFLAFHGRYGEDGCIQGLLELIDAAYTGCDPFSSAIAMNKYQCKMLLKSHNIPSLPCCLIHRSEARKDFYTAIQRIVKSPELQAFPLFVKPNNLGSSIGISVAHDLTTLKTAVAHALKYDSSVIVEPCITNLTEINISVIDDGSSKASVIEMPIASNKILTFEEKYLKGGSKIDNASEGMASLSRIINPSHIDDHVKTKITQWALQASYILGCSGVNRFDFIINNNDCAIYFNELNPIPGSLAFYLWEKTTPRLLYSDLIDILIQQAEGKKEKRKSVSLNSSFKSIMKE